MRIGSAIRKGILRIAQPRTVTVSQVTMSRVDQRSTSVNFEDDIELRATLGICDDGEAGENSNVATGGV